VIKCVDQGRLILRVDIGRVDALACIFWVRVDGLEVGEICSHLALRVGLVQGATGIRRDDLDLVELIDGEDGEVGSLEDVLDADFLVDKTTIEIGVNHCAIWEMGLNDDLIKASLVWRESGILGIKRSSVRETYSSIS
jgi:hypothetical protein